MKEQSAWGSYPATRLRRLRAQGWIREMVRERHLHVKDLILPVFVHEGDEPRPISSLPGVLRHDLKTLVDIAREAADFGIPALMLFPAIDPNLKDSQGSYAWQKDNLTCRAIQKLKHSIPEIGIITDVALDPYTDHGHDGVLVEGQVDNDRSLELLCRQALVQAQAGSNWLAPSDMMDGRIAAIRGHLDQNGFADVALLSYAAKYASAFYGPFREAVGSAKLLKTSKKTYQMDPANSKEALREIALDIKEGADAIMVKPGMPYLDIIRQTADHFAVPVFAYQVSGEYAMLRLGADQGLGSYQDMMWESLLAFKRAGACSIVTYAALDMARFLSSR